MNSKSIPLNHIERVDNCCGCQACKQACPYDAIRMTGDKEGFLYPVIEVSKCRNCGICDHVCPELDLYSTDKDIPKIIACFRKDIKKRLISQSGGVFALVAEQVIHQGGVVFGAAYDKTWKVIHRHAKNELELLGLLGSKYVQSDVGSTFQSVKEYLEQKTLTLFSGTPCQVQGLKKYLRKEYPNLITVDLICHGVSSPEVWKKFLIEFTDGDRLINYVQKDKTKNDSVVYTLEKRGEEAYKYSINPFTKGYINNFYLRPSCHNCSFKGVNRCSDITLGDFWGIDQFFPDFYDEYGISAVLLHTVKGQELMQRIHKEIHSIECNSEMLLKENPCIVDSTAYTNQRKSFFRLWKKHGVISTIEKLTSYEYLRRISRWNRVKGMFDFISKQQ